LSQDTGQQWDTVRQYGIFRPIKDGPYPAERLSACQRILLDLETVSLHFSTVFTKTNPITIHVNNVRRTEVVITSETIEHVKS
jgi:hypothetical protein